MELVALMPYTASIELVLAEAKERGFTNETMMMIPLRSPNDAPKTIEAVGTGGRTNWDLGFVLGTIGMLLGGIYGYILPGGPILWALFGLIAWFAIGIGINAMLQHRRHRRHRESRSGILIWLRCEDKDKEPLRQWLEKSGADGFATIGEHKGIAIR